MIESLERLTSAVEAARVDIAPEYGEYVQLAFAIATDCGEAGRGYFHRLCALSAKYRREEADKVFSNALRSNQNRVHLGTVFHLAETKGVTRVEMTEREEVTSPKQKNALNAKMQLHRFSHTRAREGLENYISENETLLPGSEPSTPLPTFPEADWPEPLRTAVSYGATPAQKDIMLLSAVTVIGASLSKQVRCSYGGRMLSPCLQTFIVAPPASGKGLMSLTRLLVQPLHDELRKQTEEAMKEYQKQKNDYETLGKERYKTEAPKKPVNRMFLISGNNTGTGILQNIMDANGIGLIFEPEADTLSTAIGSEYGRFSDTLRKSFDHEWLAYNRRTDNEYREVRKSFLSVLISGTPAQVRPLIPSAENGLFSRQVFYYMPGIRQWQDQFDRTETDMESTFTRMGKEWKQRLDELRLKGLFTLKLSEDQKKEFNKRFSNLFRHSGCANGMEMNSAVIRLAINLCRIMSVVAVLRNNFTPDAQTNADNIKDGIIQRWDMALSDGDFQTVMDMMLPLYRHATHILSLLPETEINRRWNSERDALISSLPVVFTRQTLIDQAAAMNIKPNTALSWLQRLIKHGIVKATGRIGEYQKEDFLTRARV